MPRCSPAARTRAFRTRSTSPWTPRDFSRRSNLTSRDAGLSMGFKCGIVGLPNVGKSTLFNALTETAAAQAANYPFWTNEANGGRVGGAGPAPRRPAQAAKSAEIVPTRLTFVDIAGLVRG